MREAGEAEGNDRSEDEQVTIDGIQLTDAQRIAWLTDDEKGQTPKIRATFIPGFPFCVTTPSGEPIKAYRSYKTAHIVRLQLIRGIQG